LTDEELFPLGERAMQDIADDIIVLDEIVTLRRAFSNLIREISRGMMIPAVRNTDRRGNENLVKRNFQRFLARNFPVFNADPSSRLNEEEAENRMVYVGMTFAVKFQSLRGENKWTGKQNWKAEQQRSLRGLCPPSLNAG
jgi:hypothetical protein